jgi:hypothetical protein
MPLPDGRLGVCRVLRVDADTEQVLVAGTSWIGAQAPDVSDPQLRIILRNTHHSFQNEPCLAWVSEPVPATFSYLGVIPPTEEETALSYSGYAFGWSFASIQVFAQWRWDHERDKVLAEEEEEERLKQVAREEKRHAYKPLPSLTLEEFRQRTPFPNWAGYIESGALRGARRIIRETIDALLEIGSDAPAPLKLDVFRHCVQRFNRLDVEQGGFIETIEREDICELLDELAGLVDLDDYEDGLTSAREW